MCFGNLKPSFAGEAGWSTSQPSGVDHSGRILTVAGMRVTLRHAPNQTCDVSLMADLSAFVSDQVAAGQHKSPGAVLRDRVRP